ncbi:hypothetical protein [Larkinella rosea]|uniref:Carboxypeptidase regulatory-like domain-containing protein n=1 Tax=Larkinella rosea TaxID=2025312 RepID=A0A3P1BP16_9BACT|nr:hypothetical protein [Larkinella rosea]RRB02809.1 hypothetical protein EHT25_20430 [Larkinella rosea]
MKPHPFCWLPFRTHRSRYFLVWLALTLVSCEKCEIYPERPNSNTVIFGRVTDEKNGLPVEGLEVQLIGTKKFIYLVSSKILTKSVSDRDGKYQIELNVSKEIGELSLFPQLYFTSKDSTLYIGHIVNGDRMNSCCPASIGQRTEYNFQLIRRL